MAVLKSSHMLSSICSTHGPMVPEKSIRSVSTLDTTSFTLDVSLLISYQSVTACAFAPSAPAGPVMMSARSKGDTSGPAARAPSC